MHMGMVPLIVEGGVPPELIPGNFHGLRHLHGVAGEEFFPLPGAVVPQPGRVLPPQGENGKPHISRVAGHLLRDAGQHQRIV